MFACEKLVIELDVKKQYFFTRTILNEYIKATNYILHAYNQKKVVEC